MDRKKIIITYKKAVYFLITLMVALVYIGLIHAEENEPIMWNNTMLAEELAGLIKQYDQPAMAAALITGDSIVAHAAVGTIVYGGDVSVREDSRFHLGSTTKSMTALLVAMLVKEGKLSYDITLEQALPDIPMRDEYRNVTIADILDNKAGIIAFQLTTMEDPAIVKTLMEEIPAEYPDPIEQRREVTKLALSLEPIAEPGTKVVYSNVGWPIVGYVLEITTGQSYEELLKKRIFEPLGMTTARVGGWPASEAEPNQPRGHYFVQDTIGKPVPQPLDDEYVLSAWMNPSGGVHCSINDFAVYAREHLLGLQGKGTLLDQKGYKTLHSIQVTTNLRDMYPHMKQDREVSFGYGWGIRKEEKGFVSAAAGSGGTFFAQIYIYPALNTAFVGFTNCGNGGRALTDLAKKIGGY